MGCSETSEPCGEVIASCSHGIASHGFGNKLITSQTLGLFREDIRNSKDTSKIQLEDVQVLNHYPSVIEHLQELVPTFHRLETCNQLYE